MIIRRLMAQRASIERAGDLVVSLEGPAILLGLGDGKATRAAERIEGDPRETLPRSWERLKRSATLALINFPITDEARLAAEVAPLVAPILRSGAVVVSETAVELPG